MDCCFLCHILSNAIGCKLWAYKVKYKSNGTIERYTARLVAKRYTQQYGIDYIETFNHVVKMTTIRLMLAVEAAKRWLVHQLDMNNVFWMVIYLRRCIFLSLVLSFLWDMFVSWTGPCMVWNKHQGSGRPSWLWVRYLWGFLRVGMITTILLKDKKES